MSAVLDQLRAAGIDTTAAVLRDSSGLSVDDRLTALTLDEVITAATGDDQPALRPLVDLLPIAGGSGTLSNRYLDTPAGREAAGWLRAKTGSLSGVNAISGQLVTKDGRLLVFAILADDTGNSLAARAALDRIAARLVACGC